MNTAANDAFGPDDREKMTRAIASAGRVRCITSPNPWVGASLRCENGKTYEGATAEPGGPHAEIAALNAAVDDGSSPIGGTLFVTLEPCSTVGRTGPCTAAIIEAGVTRVVIGIEDPDRNVCGSGIAALRAAGIEVQIGLYEDRIRQQLAPYIRHRTTGRPWVVLKLASSLDGATAAPDGTSQWITSPDARADGHRLRAESDAIIIGAGTVRHDNPSLTVRDYRPPVIRKVGNVNPIRVVLGAAPPDAKVQPCKEMRGELPAILDELGSEGVMQVLVEGGAMVASEFHRAGLVDHYVIYVAPVLFGGGDARGLFTGLGAYTIDDVWRGSFDSIERVGDDLRIEMSARHARGDD
jgi:diaminohydroxyphosphoribosylaminopyrimidine deaminase/5-amino-6-(5-phosphoribosylamino)uracil reductase